MNYHSITTPRFSIYSIVFLFLFSGFAQAQRIEPDNQIKQQMMAYVQKVESTFDTTRPRIFSESDSTESYSRNKTNSLTAGEKSANFSYERKAFDILNQIRASKGLSPLRWNEELAEVARLHSENMARYKFFGHEGRDGTTVNTRAKSFGVRGWRSIGENIAFNKGFKKPVEMACQHWMNSTGHRENILDRGWTESAIGVAVTPDGSYYFTQVFLTR